MQAYFIKYYIRGRDKEYHAYVYARDLKSAKKKIGRKHGYKDGRMVYITYVSIIGYF